MELLLLIVMMVFSSFCLLILLLAVFSLYRKKVDEPQEQSNQINTM
ncbi:MAG: hypothetical protein JNK38_12345 [Acidobacteria bacterium]|nr:hypothetical protein [Acidobacteriota bacterium]